MLKSGTVLRDSYLIMRPLGQGGMGRSILPGISGSAARLP